MCTLYVSKHVQVVGRYVTKFYSVTLIIKNRETVLVRSHLTGRNDNNNDRLTTDATYATLLTSRVVLSPVAPGLKTSPGPPVRVVPLPVVRWKGGK